MEETTKEWFEKEVGNWSLGLLFMVAFVASKIAIFGWVLDILWECVWFGTIIISALIADLFNNADTWTYNSFQIIDNMKLSREERISMIKSQLEIAVDRYMAVFLMVNGFDSLLKRIGAMANKIFKGRITIKEIIVLLAYAIYNLLLKDLPFDLGAADEILLLFIIVILKIIDSNAGVARLIAEMYQEVELEGKQDEYLLKIRDRIISLAHIYHIETITNETPTTLPL